MFTQKQLDGLLARMSRHELEQVAEAASLRAAERAPNEPTATLALSVGAKSVGGLRERIVNRGPRARTVFSGTSEVVLNNGTRFRAVGRPRVLGGKSFIEFFPMPPVKPRPMPPR